MKTITQKIVKVVLLITFHLSLFTQNAQAQAPQKMSYQAVIRNASNTLVANAPVAIKVSILQGSATGTATYVERHTPTTNVNGLATFEIGTGSVISGVFSNIDWKNSQFHIKTETDPAGGTNYTIVGTSQLTSVPYALNAKTSEDNKWKNATMGIATAQGGNVGINENNPIFPLHFATNYGDKISLWGGLADRVGFAVQPSKFQMLADAGTDLVFGAGASLTPTEFMTIKSSGQVCIGTNTPFNINTGLTLKKNINDYYGTYVDAGLTGKPFYGYALDGSYKAWTTYNGLNNNWELYTGTSLSTSKIAVSSNGNVGIGTDAPTTKLEVNGFTKLGSDAPAIKVKKLTGTTASTQNSTVTILHGLTFSKILSIDVLVESNGYLIPEAYDYNGYDFSYYSNTTEIVVYNSETNSNNILSKPIKILVTYEE